jgi:molybdopterin-guanine dinucleotide biosynthesis protein A
MTGVILCGGQSTRMGTDKGLLEAPLPSQGGYLNQANTWAQTAVDKLAELQLPVVISVNKNQFSDYATTFSPQQLITDNESLQIKGPLAGLLSVHVQHPSEDLLLLACDMPLMETNLLKELITIYNQHTTADAFVYTNDDQPEPLCGIYKSSGLKYILQLYYSNQLPKHSMKYMLEHINTQLIPLTDDKKKCFRNFNAHAELNGL